jgi:hypothetical protein
MANTQAKNAANLQQSKKNRHISFGLKLHPFLDNSLLWVPYKMGNFLTSWETISFSRTMLHEVNLLDILY